MVTGCDLGPPTTKRFKKNQHQDFDACIPTENIKVTPVSHEPI